MREFRAFYLAVRRQVEISVAAVPVAAGTLDLVIEAGLKCWDIDAAIPVIEGAGGAVTDWRGDAVGTLGGQVVIGGDRGMIAAAVEILRPAAT